MKRLVNFVFYNNGFVFMVLVVLFSGGSVLAATNEEVRNAVVSSEERLQTVDNSYIRDVDLKKHDFDIKIIKVEKDDINYYVTYEFNTISLVEGAWQKIIKVDVLTINIEQLEGKDVGLYAAEELKEQVNYTKSFLSEVQLNERKKGESDKVVAKTYKGLVGRYLSEDKITFAGYNPVIKPPVKVVATEPKIPTEEVVEEVPLEDIVINNGSENTDSSNTDNSNTDSGVSTSTTEVVDTIAPIIVLIGDSLVSLSVNETYQELGATANDDVDGDVTSSIVVENVIDTSVTGEHEVKYTVNDSAGNLASVTRKIIVSAPQTNTEPEANSEEVVETIVEPEANPETTPQSDGEVVI